MFLGLKSKIVLIISKILVSGIVLVLNVSILIPIGEESPIA